MHIEKDKKKILEIIVYGDGSVTVIQNNKEVRCTQVEFKASIDSVPVLTTTQPVFDYEPKEKMEVFRNEKAD